MDDLEAAWVELQEANETHALVRRPHRTAPGITAPAADHDGGYGGCCDFRLLRHEPRPSRPLPRARGRLKISQSDARFQPLSVGPRARVARCSFQESQHLNSRRRTSNARGQCSFTYTGPQLPGAARRVSGSLTATRSSPKVDGGEGNRAMRSPISPTAGGGRRPEPGGNAGSSGGEQRRLGNGPSEGD